MQSIHTALEFVYLKLLFLSLSVLFFSCVLTGAAGGPGGGEIKPVYPIPLPVCTVAVVHMYVLLLAGLYPCATTCASLASCAFVFRERMISVP